ncbi:hypothetical protein KSC_037570 [Ktedonobacter sp. SOSP1-52]|uniref:sensor histidine kinase n=1 Tax=Ktedonobacter sp. SOSP1-52 TaxID=2778366 RepID=UPI00191683FC|nr:sensor histidine kinase [Ktedonobacter sp. SOSP1-52]GHO64865.1 hypothetical protein KSC_037570 [Ktedonobacter sp. SOSP1-52]
MAHADTRPIYRGILKRNTLLRQLFRIPALYKVLIANSFIIFVGATAGTWLATHINTYGPSGLLIFVVIGWSMSVILNFVLLQIAFRPLIELGRIMGRVREGDRTQRADVTGFDPLADQLAGTFNMMLEAIDDANRQRASQITNAMEEERKRIARELHDETSQVLTSLLISLAVLEESVKTQDARDRIADTRMLAHQTLRAIRNLSIDLRPSALDDLGLVPALRWYVKEYQQKFPVSISFQAVGFKERLNNDLETVLYRIVQEALTNIAKHAQAQNATVMLKEDQDGIYATITDDGRGFNADQLRGSPGAGQERGWGLVGMRERADLFDGTLNIESQPGKGTTVQVYIPLPKEKLKKYNYEKV